MKVYRQVMEILREYLIAFEAHNLTLMGSASFSTVYWGKLLHIRWTHADNHERRREYYEAIRDFFGLIDQRRGAVIDLMVYMLQNDSDDGIVCMAMDAAAGQISERGRDAIITCINFHVDPAWNYGGRGPYKFSDDVREGRVRRVEPGSIAKYVEARERTKIL